MAAITTLLDPFHGGSLYIDDANRPTGIETTIVTRELSPTAYFNVPMKSWSAICAEPALRQTFFSRLQILFTPVQPCHNMCGIVWKSWQP